MNGRDWQRPLEFGDAEPLVRILEEASPENLTAEICRRLARKTDEDDLYLAAARAAARSTRYEGLGSGRAPRGLYCLRAHRELGSRLPSDLRPYPLIAACRRVHAEIHDPAFGPTRLLAYPPHAEGSREEILFTYLEAVRFGDTDPADHLLAWLLKNVSPDEMADLLWTSGLEGACVSSFRLAGAVEVFLFLQALGWPHAEVLLRPVVRHQAMPSSRTNAFEAIRDRIAAEGLHERARRRLPGERGKGDDDPAAVWDQAIRWGRAGAEERTTIASRLLSSGWALEDVWEAISLATALLFLGASTSGRPVPAAAQIVVATHGLRGMLRLGSLGQKVLATLIAGRSPEFAALGPADVDAGVRLLEEGLRASHVSADELGATLEGRQAEGALACVASASAQPAGLSALMPILDHRLAFLHGLEGLGPLFHQAQCDAFQAARSQHRWVHLAASAWLCAVWPDRGLLDEPSLADLAERRRRALSRKRRPA
ncbi:MAG: hypothetical protein QUU85_12675 [Candidatus Eisenbacteria bacterium]|nr:hypothetical protein [Candidatus Eisenbacteria bacterium]